MYPQAARKKDREAFPKKSLRTIGPAVTLPVKKPRLKIRKKSVILALVIVWHHQETIRDKLFNSNTGKLVLGAKSEIIDSALRDEKALNPKREIRNPKQYPMTKIQMTQTTGIPASRLYFCHYDI